ncbi:hypothetical protein DACRYDRAFT_92385, partial [Dacryopinax primogenitus]
ARCLHLSLVHSLFPLSLQRPPNPPATKVLFPALPHRPQHVPRTLRSAQASLNRPSDIDISLNGRSTARRHRPSTAASDPQSAATTNTTTILLHKPQVAS